MKISQKACVPLLIFLALGLEACTPVEQPNTASITGRVYLDADNSGECENGESGIAGMSIRLYSGVCGENLLQTHYTNDSGEFVFSELAPGEYCVFPDFEYRSCGFAGNYPTKGISRRVTLESGMKADLVWFGFGNLSGKEQD